MADDGEFGTDEVGMNYSNSAFQNNSHKNDMTKVQFNEQTIEEIDQVAKLMRQQKEKMNIDDDGDPKTPYNEMTEEEQQMLDS